MDPPVLVSRSPGHSSETSSLETPQEPPIMGPMGRMGLMGTMGPMDPTHYFKIMGSMQRGRPHRREAGMIIETTTRVQLLHQSSHIAQQSSQYHHKSWAARPGTPTRLQ